ncbi:MAG TPA: hypothetical protein VI197_24135 [Polyangiaceae bacterium]
MSTETEAFLESVRGAEDPTPADERRVLTRVQTVVAAGAVLGTAAATSKWSRLWTWSAGAGFKSGAAVVVVVAAAAGGVATLTGAFTPRAAPVQVRGGAVTQLAPVARPAPLAKPERITEPVPLTPPVPVAPPTAAPKPKSGPVASSLREELAVLAGAQAALRRGDGAEALRVLEGGSKRSPQLAAERATLRILALCAVGRSGEARRLAAALDRVDPGSLQRDVISRSCAGSETSPRR